MNLQELSAPLPKPWLAIRASVIQADTFSADAVDLPEMELKNNAAPTVPNANNLTLYAVGDQLHYLDDNGTDFKVFTTADAGAYLPLVGGTMTGNIALGGFAIGAAATANGGTCFGDGANSGGVASVALGRVSNAGGLGSIAIGNAAVCSTNNSLAVGISSNNSAVGGISLGRSNINSGVDGISIGTSANCSVGNGICIGTSSAASVSGAIAIGVNAVNNVADTTLIGHPGISSIRPNSAVCDLGTLASPYKDLYLSGNILSPAISKTYRIDPTLSGIVMPFDSDISFRWDAVNKQIQFRLSGTTLSGSPSIVSGTSFYRSGASGSSNSYTVTPFVAATNYYTNLSTTRDNGYDMTPLATGAWLRWFFCAGTLFTSTIPTYSVTVIAASAFTGASITIKKDYN